MLDVSSLVVLRPGRIPAQAVVWHAEQEWLMPLGAAEQLPSPNSRNEAQARAGFSAVREVLVAAWATLAGPETGAPDVRARAVRRLTDELWCFELVDGSSISVPSQWIGPGVDLASEVPRPLRDGRWWIWPAAGVAVELGDLLLRQLSGQQDGTGLFCSPLPAVSVDAAPQGQVSRPLLGLILARQGLLGRAELGVALRAQQRNLVAGKRVKLGEVCVALGLLEPYQFDFALAFQQRVQKLEALDQHFVDHLLQLDLASPASLLLALDRLPQTGGRLRDFIVADGLVDARVLEEFQARPAALGADTTTTHPADARSAPSPHLLPDELGDGDSGVPDIGPNIGGAALRSLLGAILLREKLITHEQLNLLLAEQMRRRRIGEPVAFGQLAVKLGFIQQTQLDFAIELQSRLDAGTRGPRPLGLFLIEYGVLKPSQVSKALEEAKETERPLGKVLVRQGLLTLEHLRVFLEMQRRAIEIQ